MQLSVKDVTNNTLYTFTVTNAAMSVVQCLNQTKGLDNNNNLLVYNGRYLYAYKNRITRPLNPKKCSLQPVCISSSPYECTEKHVNPINAKYAWLTMCTIQDVPSDGNCYFHAIIRSIFYRYFNKLKKWNTVEDFDHTYDFQMHQPPQLPRFYTEDCLLREQAADQLRMLIGYYMVMFYGFHDKDIEGSKYIENWFEAKKENHVVTIKGKIPAFDEIALDTLFFTDTLSTPDFRNIPDNLLMGLYDVAHGKTVSRPPQAWGGDQFITQFVNALFDVNVIQYDDETVNNVFKNNIMDPIPLHDNTILLYRKNDHYYWLSPRVK